MCAGARDNCAVEGRHLGGRRTELKAFSVTRKLTDCSEPPRDPEATRLRVATQFGMKVKEPIQPVEAAAVDCVDQSNGIVVDREYSFMHDATIAV